MIEAIRSRIDPIPDNDKIVSMAYQLWFDCRYLLSELDYYKRVNAELSAELERLEYERLDI